MNEESLKHQGSSVIVFYDLHTSSTTVYESLLEERKAIGRPRVREKDQVHKDMQICNREREVAASRL